MQKHEVTEPWAEEFLELVADGASLTKASKEAGVSRWTVWRRREEDEDFNRRVVVAMQMQGDSFIEQAREILDEVRTGKIAAKAGQTAANICFKMAESLFPGIWGKKTTIEHEHTFKPEALTLQEKAEQIEGQANG